jgi:hypothetical protein
LLERHKEPRVIGELEHHSFLLNSIVLEFLDAAIASDPMFDVNDQIAVANL